ncbi:Calcium-dependent protein kinase 25 [Amphibalanus amphitrite]|uniref:Calcium-dependent protein kinase 25 n=1 Tax=Amphibalanus amphitrite TaxID=1232801 RepID=A0A6A4VV66_AMPAM|nr:calmodulin-like protein 5 [Amphibalanus amphitrite]KAF0294682.1 Calcium-dependent protein kinase 25 [Amphibalanus amphitrite]
MLKFIVTVVLVGTLCVAQPLPVDEVSLRGVFQAMLGQLDSDGDGRITLAEFLPLWRPSQPNFTDDQFRIEFDALDRDGDGAVSETDFVTAASHPAPPELVPLSFQSADADGDGHLTEAQANQVAEALNLADAEHVRYAIQHADHDGDGTFDLADFVDATEALRRGGA